MRTADLVAARRIRNYWREVATATARPEFGSRSSERWVMILRLFCYVFRSYLLIFQEG
jgi:hypothetical protein